MDKVFPDIPLLGGVYSWIYVPGLDFPLGGELPTLDHSLEIPVGVYRDLFHENRVISSEQTE